jgi:hypothetical protein
MTREFKPGDRVHYDGLRAGPLPADEENTPGWGTVVELDRVPRSLRSTLGDRTAVAWDVPIEDGDDSYPTTMPETPCLVPASEAPEPDPKES